MAKTDNINIRIEPELKKEVETTLNDLGMNLAEAITIYLKQIVLTDSIPFIIKKPKFTDEMLEALKEAEAIMKNPDTSPSYHSVDELMEALNDE